MFFWCEHRKKKGPLRAYLQPSVERAILTRSVFINQLLYAFACREGNGASAHTPNRLRQAFFRATAGGHLLATLLSGGPGRAAGNLLALWSSRRHPSLPLSR